MIVEIGIEAEPHRLALVEGGLDGSDHLRLAQRGIVDLRRRDLGDRVARCRADEGRIDQAR